VATGAAREIYCYGARGDGKSIAALWGQVMHAVEHKRHGFALPVIWLGIRDTFRNHELTTHKSLTNPLWDGRWRLVKGGKVGLFTLDGLPLVRLELIGVDSPSDADRARTECHGIWVDEPSPAMGVSGGISRDLYGIALSSQRLETHARVAMLTSNAPDEMDWTWQRFMENREPGTMAFHIPAGERASEEYRRELEVAYRDRPDLMRRLVQGLPGAVILGAQVAEGFNEELHAPTGMPLKIERDQRVYIGQDGGLSPTCVIGQRVGPWVRILAALRTEHGGIKQHFEYLVRPWLAEFTPWVFRNPEALRVFYDPSMNVDDEGDSTNNSVRIMRSLLPGIYAPGPVDWERRKNPMLAVFNAMAEGRPVLSIDRGQARGLVRALVGGWHYPTAANGMVTRDKPVKDHPHSDYGDAFCYLVGGVAPLREPRTVPREAYARTEFSVHTYRSGGPQRFAGAAQRYAETGRD
jgi:hypothetical protein